MFNVGDRVEFWSPTPGRNDEHNGNVGTVTGDYPKKAPGYAYFVLFDNPHLTNYSTGGILGTFIRKFDDSKDFEFDI